MDASIGLSQNISLHDQRLRKTKTDQPVLCSFEQADQQDTDSPHQYSRTLPLILLKISFWRIKFHWNAIFLNDENVILKMGQEVWISDISVKSCGLFELVQEESPHPVQYMVS